MKRWSGVILAVATIVACTDQVPNGNDGGMDASVGNDASADSGVSDTSSDSPSDQEVGSDAADAGTVYSALNDTSKWATFDITTVNAGANGFIGAAFDGRYVYFVPSTTNGTTTGADGLVARYDTTAAFTTGSSWLIFDTTTVNAGAMGFEGAVFDGQYVYFVPNYNTSGVNDGLVTRYDTTAAFTTGSSWSTFDMATVNAGAKGYASAAFDGHYVYFAPYGNTTNGLVVRYDTTAAFTTGSSWSIFDATTVNAAAKGFVGAAFDTRYIYFVPNYANPSRDGLVVRYDTTVAFSTASSWSTFDMTTLNAAATSCIGAVFDGRYMYFVPNYNTTYDGLLGRYDTQATFTTGASWSIFDTTTVNAGAKGFWGGAFDGRYVYFGPHANSTSGDGIVTRYDTLATFATGTSWSTFDVTTVNAGAEGFYGSVFDGRYLYFVPGEDGIAARFDAKTPPSLPPGYAHGSFF